MMVYACVSRGLMNAASAVTNMQGPEVLEASYRGTGSGYFNACCLLGGMIVPYWIFTHWSREVIASGLASVMLLNALVVHFTPETALSALDAPDSLSDSSTEVYETTSIRKKQAE